jgi:hypothetical protein
MALWKPSNLSATLTCWYLPENTTTIEAGLSDGVAVTSWANQQSPIVGELTQVTSSRRPTLLNSKLNGQGRVKFDGSDILSDGDISDLDVGTGDIWFAIVFKSNDTSDVQIPFEKDHLKFGIVIQSNGDLEFRLGGPGSSNRAEQTAGNWSRTGFVIASASRVSATINAFVNGDAADITGTTNTQSISSSSVLELGGRAATASGKLDGEMCELLIGGGTITDAELVEVNGYLAEKFGLSGNLPATHKYKQHPPTESLEISGTSGDIEGGLTQSISSELTTVRI